MSSKSLDLKELKAIVDWVGVTNDVREFSLKFGDVELFVSRNQQASAAGIHHQPHAATPALVPAAPAGTASTPSSALELASDEVLIKAPMVGTFYAAAKPGAPNFVRIGDVVQPKTILCIVEVMKLMNSVEAGVDGTVARILVVNEQAVEYGQPMMVIKRRARA